MVKGLGKRRSLWTQYWRDLTNSEISLFLLFESYRIILSILYFLLPKNFISVPLFRVPLTIFSIPTTSVHHFYAHFYIVLLFIIPLFATTFNILSRTAHFLSYCLFLCSIPSSSLQLRTTCVTFQFPVTEQRLPNPSVDCPPFYLYVICNGISSSTSFEISLMYVLELSFFLPKRVLFR
jgi:hypothetical protein